MGRPKGSTNKGSKKAVKPKVAAAKSDESTSKGVGKLAAKGLINGKKALTDQEFRSVCGSALTQVADDAREALKLFMGVLTANDAGDVDAAPKKRRKRRAKATNGHDEDAGTEEAEGDENHGSTTADDGEEDTADTSA